MVMQLLKVIDKVVNPSCVKVLQVMSVNHGRGV